jgi:hypothetical protein
MPYRTTPRSAAQRERVRQAMRAGADKTRAARPAPEYPLPRPVLRRTVIVIDHDFGLRTHTIRLYRTPRIDQYRATVNGAPWKARIGWSRVLAALRKGLPRLPSPRRVW